MLSRYIRVMVAAGLLAVSLAAAPGRALPRGTRIAVVAIRDSDFLTVCPVLGTDVVASTGAVVSKPAEVVVRVYYPTSSSTTQEVSLMLPDGGVSANVQLPRLPSRSGGSIPSASEGRTVLLDRLAHDRDAELAVGEEFRRRKRFTLVDSPEKADYVFLVETTHVAMAVWSQPPRPSPPGTVAPRAAVLDTRPSEKIWDDVGRSLSTIRNSSRAAVQRPDLRPPSAVTPSMVWVGNDRPQNYRQSALAVVVPSKEYLRNGNSAQALVAARSWEGLAFGMTERGSLMPASLVDLVDEFHDGRSPYLHQLPVCGLPPIADRPVNLEPASPEPPAVPRAALAAVGTTFRSHVTLVRVPVAVSDAEGRALADLATASFHVFEDGMEQRVDRVLPATAGAAIALLLDTSSSMRLARADLQRGALSLLDTLPPDDETMVVTFGDRIRVRAEMSRDRGPARRALSALGTSQATRLSDAVYLAVADRIAGAGFGRKVLVLFTDGLDTASRLADTQRALQTIDEANVVVYVIRYDTSDNPVIFPWPPSEKSPPPRGSARWLVAPDDIGQGEMDTADRFLASLARSTGGRLYLAEQDSNLQEIFTHIRSELSHQYTLLYYPTDDRLDGSYRRLTVTVDVPGCRVRARAGYRAAVAK